MARIAFLINSLSNSGGAERVLTNLCNELIYEFDIVIIVFSEGKPFYKLHKKIKIIPCLANFDKPANSYDSIKLNIKLIQKIIKILKTNRTNLIIGFLTTSNILSVIASKWLGIPSMICERNNPMFEFVPKFWIFLRNYFYPKADLLVVQTNGVKEFYKSKVAPEKICILPNPIDENLTIQRNNTNKREKIILSVGRLHKDKCHDLLINVFSEIYYDDWQLIIVGDGECRPELESLIKKLGMSKSIHLPSSTNNISKYYNCASIFAFLSRSEGFPNVLIEAMHYGLACISANCDFGPSELIKNGENGYLIDVDDKDGLKKNLQIMMSDKILREKFGHEAKKSTIPYQKINAIKKWSKLIHSFNI